MITFLSSPSDPKSSQTDLVLFSSPSIPVVGKWWNDRHHLSHSGCHAEDNNKHVKMITASLLSPKHDTQRGWRWACIVGWHDLHSTMERDYEKGGLSNLVSVCLSQPKQINNWRTVLRVMHPPKFHVPRKHPTLHAWMLAASQTILTEKSINNKTHLALGLINTHIHYCNLHCCIHFKERSKPSPSPH